MRLCKERNIRSLAAMGDLETIAKENWKGQAKKVAEDYFPIDSFAVFYNPEKERYGKIESINKKGMITVREGRFQKKEGTAEIYTKDSFRPLENHQTIEFTPYFQNGEMTWRADENNAFSLLCRLYEGKDRFLSERP